jgi:hypothetical protein
MAFAGAFSAATLAAAVAAAAAPLPMVPVAGQPLAANALRLLEALEFLGAPLAQESASAIRAAAAERDPDQLQEQLDPHAWFVVELNPESRVKVRRGPAPAGLQQAGWTVALVKIINHSTVTKELRILSPQAGPVFAGMTPLSAQRLQRTQLKETDVKQADANKFLELELYARPPMNAALSGLEVEYALALIYSRDAGRLDATIGFDVGQGSQDVGFRGEVGVLFDARPAVPVTVHIADHDGAPATAFLLFRDAAGHVYPPQAKRLAPDFYFQPQIYRHDGEIVRLPPGKFTLRYGRGPEYKLLTRAIEIAPGSSPIIELRLERWTDPRARGFYSGDHHIHGAGCAHYTSPTEGVTPEDMFRQVAGEGLNVGCVLTWGPCYDYQRRFFAPEVHQLSRPLTILKYDLEISGFGSEALGHVCLLNLKDQTYPGSDGTKAKGWPSWTTPVMRWAKAQGGVTGYAHAASGLEIQPAAASRRLAERFDADNDGLLTAKETADALLPAPFAEIDANNDRALDESELIQAHDRAAQRLPNLAVPEMNGVGAMEICVSVAAGACDFISAMDTSRIAEWNMWYHILNCGFPLKVSGETDFPCMSGERVGQGRVYVQLGKHSRLDFGAWCDALAGGRSYVSDGFAHALAFTVEGVAPGFGNVRLRAPGRVGVRATIAFAARTPATIAHGLAVAPGGKQFIGDTVTLHGSRTEAEVAGGTRRVEVVMNGAAVAAHDVPADGKTHELEFAIDVDQSCWIALRQFPQLHTNPVNVIVADRPIRASRDSARWCRETIEQLWRTRGARIAATERAAARAAFDEALAAYERIAAECAPAPAPRSR